MSDVAPAGSAMATATARTGAPGRQIRLWGSVARLIVGVGLLVGALVLGVSGADLVIGFAVFPLVEVGVLAARGLDAAPLRLSGNAGHCINWGVGILAFSFLTEAALLFYGVSILLAFVRGYAGCEICAISNWLRRRDDQVVCPIFSPIDHAEARRAGVDPEC
ncbi:MAG: hypothetical protein HKN44_02140 [Ilumatobacter sp.]|nr:hypothetical protein [Ilumatobacter sp.]